MDKRIGTDTDVMTTDTSMLPDPPGATAAVLSTSRHAAMVAPDCTIRPVVLCGGSGTRLWPLSRAQRPKQFLELVGSQSLLQQTILRFADTLRFTAPIVVCSDQHRFAVEELLEKTGIEPATIVLEPVGRNTAPAIAAAALLADPSELLLVVPSDAYVTDTGAYVESIEAGAAAAREGWLVAFGVEPTRAETGYGYIRESGHTITDGVVRIEQFHEKPDLATARCYLEEGGFLWNAGMFLFRAQVYLDELERHGGDILIHMREAVTAAHRQSRFTVLDAVSFAEARAISIDHAVMERTERAAVTRLKAPWSDVGSWQELWRAAPHDDTDNVIIGDVIDHDCQGCYIHGDGRLVATLGLKDHVVVATSDTVMVVPRERSQEVKVLIDRLIELERPEHKAHARVFRPWGYYESIDQGRGFQVKRIMVKPGGQLSLQRHKHRSEHWTVVSGRARVTVADDVSDLTADQSAHIPLGAIHRLENFGNEPVYLIEVQCGDYLGEDDIERLKDVYHRAGPKTVAAQDAQPS